MALSKKTSKDFKITKGTSLVGSLKPDKVKKRSVTDQIIGHKNVGAGGSFGNNGTCSSK